MMNLVVNGMVKDNEGREFTRLLGGFGEDKPCIGFSVKKLSYSFKLCLSMLIAIIYKLTFELKTLYKH